MGERFDVLGACEEIYRQQDEEQAACDHLMVHDPVTNEPVKCRRCGKTQWQIEEDEGL